jgi:hypothetical protein
LEGKLLNTVISFAIGSNKYEEKLDDSPFIKTHVWFVDAIASGSTRPVIPSSY